MDSFWWGGSQNQLGWFVASVDQGVACAEAVTETRGSTSWTVVETRLQLNEVKEADPISILSLNLSQPSWLVYCRGQRTSDINHIGDKDRVLSLLRIQTLSINLKINSCIHIPRIRCNLWDKLIWSYHLTFASSNMCRVSIAVAIEPSSLVSWPVTGVCNWPTESLAQRFPVSVIGPVYPIGKLTMGGPPLFNARICNRRRCREKQRFCPNWESNQAHQGRGPVHYPPTHCSTPRGKAVAE